jgi:predicted nucleic acid-binding protein
VIVVDAPWSPTLSATKPPTVLLPDRRCAKTATSPPPTLSMSRPCRSYAKRWLAGDLTARRFRTAITDLADLAITRHPTMPFMQRAYELRANVTPYDAAFIGLAEILGCALFTADGRLASAPGPRCEIRVIQP